MLETAFALAIAFNHPTHRMVDVFQYVHVVDGAKMKIPKLVTGRDRGQQHVFSVPTYAVPAKSRVGGAKDGRLAWALHSKVSLVCRIAGSTFTRVAYPSHGDSVTVLFQRHSCVVTWPGDDPPLPFFLR